MAPDPTANAPTPDAAVEAALPGMLAGARWFGGKAAAIDRVRLHDRVRLPGEEGTEILLVDVHAAGRPDPDRYVVVRSGVTGGGVTGGGATGGSDTEDGADESAAAAAFARWLAAAVAAPAPVVLPGRGGRFVVHALPAGPTAPAARERPAHGGGVPGTTGAGRADHVAVLGGDASNSSFLVAGAGAGLTVKLLRRCRSGTQPEVEVGEFLARESSWHETPRLRGWLEHVADRPPTAGAASTAIATVHEFAPACTTAWDRLSALLARGGPGAAAVDPLLPIVARIGGATARMHAALASRPEVAAFAPRPATAAARRALADGMAAHAAAVFARIERDAGRLPPALAARLRSLLAASGRLADRFARLATIPATAADIRVHGDYHLGQVLVGEADERVLVIDFEGEPGRPLEERRAVWSAAKDVAGMCRSFDYLVRQAAKAGGPPHDQAAVARLEGCFIAAYRAAAAGGAWWPATPAEAAGLLEAFRLDKAVYELAYEFDNRPDWIDVPLAAVEQAAREADGHPGPAPAAAPA